MFKKALLISVALLFALAFAGAEAKLVSPVEKYVGAEDLTELGKAMAGETIELIFSTGSGNPESPWIAVSAEGLPNGWGAAEIMQQRNKSTLILHVSVPKEAKNSTYQFSAVLEDAKGGKETAEFLVFIQEGLLKTSVDSVMRKTTVGEPVVFTFSIDNDSIAMHRASIESSLPPTWCSPASFEIGAKSSKKISITVSPKNYGEKKFAFFIVSGLSSRTLNEIGAKIEVQPTVKSKYEAALYGFPFFTPSLLPYYLFNSLISQLA